MTTEQTTREPDLSVPPERVLPDEMFGQYGVVRALDIPGSPMVTSRIEVFSMLDIAGEWVAIYVDGILLRYYDQTHADYFTAMHFAVQLHALDVASL